MYTVAFSAWTYAHNFLWSVKHYNSHNYQLASVRSSHLGRIWNCQKTGLPSPGYSFRPCTNQKHTLFFFIKHRLSCSVWDKTFWESSCPQTYLKHQTVSVKDNAYNEVCLVQWFALAIVKETVAWKIDVAVRYLSCHCI